MVHILTTPLDSTPARSVIIPTQIIDPPSDLFFLKFKTLRIYLKIVSDYAKICQKTKSYDRRMLQLNKKIHNPPIPGDIARYKITPNRINTIPKKYRHSLENKHNLIILWTGVKTKVINNIVNRISSTVFSKFPNIITSSYGLNVLPYNGSNRDALETTIRLMSKIAVDVYIHVPKTQEKLALKLVKKHGPRIRNRKIWRVPRIKVSNKKPTRVRVKSNRVR